jgi:hypothetical protein
MRTLKLSILALALSMTPGVAFAGAESGGMGHMPMGGMGHMPTPPMGGMGHMPRPPMGGMGHMPRPPMAHMPHAGGPRNWGGNYAGRWMGGHRAPGGWNSYRRPFRGYALPSYWIQPSFYVPNYSYYGFAQPSAGYGWSRYYNDAVLTDRYGRVYDSVDNVDWDRGYRNDRGYRDDRGYDDGYDRDDRDYRRDRRRARGGNSGIGGAIAGGAIGAIAGSAIAGRGDRLPGALIGGGLGAIAGAAIDSGSRDSRTVTYGGDPGARRYDSRDAGATYRDGDRYEGDRAYESGYDDAYETTSEQTHWGRGDERTSYPAPRLPYPGYGYGYQYEPQVTTVTIQPQPATTTTTTTTYIEEEVYYAKPTRHRVVHKAPHRTWKPKPRCVCKVVYR